MHPRAMDEAPFETRAILACLGVPSRFRIAHSLLSAERCVSDLAADIGLSQSCTTRHLQALQREGLVCGARAGKRVVFRLCLDRPHVRHLLSWVTGQISNAAAVHSEGARPRDRAARGTRARPANPRPPSAAGDRPGTRRHLGPPYSQESARQPNPPRVDGPGQTSDGAQQLAPATDMFPVAGSPSDAAPPLGAARVAPRANDLEDWLL
jgi:DNA-binding transcriptional ArsR family regulator